MTITDQCMSISMFLGLAVAMFLGWLYSQADFQIAIVILSAFMSSLFWVLAATIPLYFREAFRTPALLNGCAALCALLAAMTSISYPAAYKAPSWLLNAFEIPAQLRQVERLSELHRENEMIVAKIELYSDTNLRRSLKVLQAVTHVKI